MCGSGLAVATLRDKTERTTVWGFRESKRENRMLLYVVRVVLK
jgi:hypothetical protein